METMQRKLIDLSMPVVKAIGIKARANSMSFKRYVEYLIEKDAKEGGDYALIPDEVTDPKLIGLVGIASGKGIDDGADDRLEYILSKMH